MHLGLHIEVSILARVDVRDIQSASVLVIANPPDATGFDCFLRQDPSLESSFPDSF
jgi:hypothetical protein